VVERLLEVADSACDVLVAVDGQWDEGNEAEGEPRMTLDDIARVVSAVVAPAHNPLIPLDFLAKRVFATGEDDAHGGDSSASWARL